MKKTLFLIIFALFALQLNAQIKIKELPPYDFTKTDPAFNGSSSSRQIIPFRTGWKIFSPDSPESKTDITVPSAFEGAENLIFEKEFSFTDEQAINNILELNFLGLNYSGEILINNKLIYKHPGGELPFSIELPKDLLNFGIPNKLTINLKFEPNAQNTIPFKSGFLMPQSFAGITRDVYIKLIPNTNISKFDVIKGSLNQNQNVDIEIKCGFEKFNLKVNSGEAENYSVSAVVFDNEYNDAGTSNSIDVSFDNSSKAESRFQFSIKNARLWSPESPNIYYVHLRLYKNSQVIDEVIKSIALFSFETSEGTVTLNDKPFRINGTTYLGSFNTKGNLYSYQFIEKDLREIKEAGFNAVRFSKRTPHPYEVYLCEKIGLLSFVELPSNSIPESFIEKDNFETRSKNYLRVFLNHFTKYSSTVAVGLGSSLISNSAVHQKFVGELADFVKQNYSVLTYASFIGFPNSDIDDLDFYGIELYAEPISSLTEKTSAALESINKNKLFFSEVTYPYYNGSKNGYETPFSYEAQAKYINDFIVFAKSSDIGGYFINSLFDYKGSYPSFFAGFNDENIYNIGILGKDKDVNNIAYKILKYNLNGGERVTIPIGTKQNDSPLFFILLGLGLAVIMGLVINSKRKFREDAVRALLRPYNFYADIRDHRVLSGFHTIILMLILAGSHSLLQINLLYYLRTNLLLEKLVLSTGSPAIASLINYLAWNPLQAFVYLFLLSLLMFVVISLIIKTASIFIKTRVMFSSIYFVVIWAFLPFALMLPVELILYKILQNGTFNYYIYIVFILFSMWIAQRILKGVFVIFDIPSYRVYLYTLLLAIVVIGAKLLYFQLSESTIDYIITSVKQFQLM